MGMRWIHNAWNYRNSQVKLSQHPKKEQAWADLEFLMHDKDILVRRNAISSGGSVYSYIPQKVLVWNDLLQFAQEKDRDIRIIANDSLPEARCVNLEKQNI